MATEWASSNAVPATGSSPPFVAPAADPGRGAEGPASEERLTGAEPAAPPALASADAIAEAMVDPLNRYYRYPAARALLPVLGKLPLTPNHVTYLHTLMALGGAYLAYVGGRREHVMAFFLLEARMVLDCYDGVLARAKRLSSPYGRALDEIGDTVGFIALMIAITARLHAELHTSLVVWLTCGVLAFGGLCANAWDFYKRKVSFALREGRDGVADELAEKRAAIANATGGALAYWGVYFDRFQMWLYDVDSDDVVGSLRRRAESPELRRFARLVAFLSWDNGIFIMHLALLTGALLELELFALAWALALWTTAILTGRRLLRPVTKAG